MNRTFLHSAAALLVLALMDGSVLAVTQFTPTGINVRQKWIVDQTDMTLQDAPPSQFIDDPDAFAKLWKTWRKDDVPKVDFSKEIVLVVTGLENARVYIDATLNDKGVLDITVKATQRAAFGKTYVIAIVDRAGIKAVGKTPLQPAK